MSSEKEKKYSRLILLLWHSVGQTLSPPAAPWLFMNLRATGAHIFGKTDTKHSSCRGEREEHGKSGDWTSAPTLCDSIFYILGAGLGIG